MKFSLEPSHPNSIQSYTSGQITVAGKVYTRSLVINPFSSPADWSPQDFESLTAEHISDLLTLDPEIVILGTGTTLRFPDASISCSLFERQVGIEVMDTASACRTYNVLLNEDRRVVAALLMIQPVRE